MGGDGTVVDAPYERGVGCVGSVFVYGCFSEVDIRVHG